MAKKVSKKTATKTGNDDAKTKRVAVAGNKPDVAAALAELDEVWSTTEAASIGGDIPEGKYQCRIESAEIGHSQNGRFQVVFTLAIASGEFTNRKLWKRDGIDNEQSISFFKAGLSRLGVEAPAKMSELPPVLEELAGTFCQVSVKHKDEFLNVYFNKALDDGDIEAGAGEETVDPNAGEGEAGETGGGEERTYAKGDKVQADFGGDWYSGTVQKVKGTTATVLFEDGETLDKEFSELSPVDDGGGEGGDDETCNATFAEKAISPALQKRITVVAKASDYNPDDYDTWLPLLTELAEYHGVTGDFDDAAKLVKAIETAAAS